MFQWARRPLVGGTSQPPAPPRDSEPEEEPIRAGNGVAEQAATIEPAEDLEILRRLLDKRFEATEKRLESEQRLKEEVERLEDENARLTGDVATARERAVRAAELTAELERTLHASEQTSERERRQLEIELAGEREMRSSMAAELVDEKTRTAQLQSDLVAEWNRRAIDRVREFPQWRYSAALAIAAIVTVLVVAAFAQRQLSTSAASRARLVAATGQAQAGLGQPSPRVGAILTLDAYRQVRDPEKNAPLRSALLSALLADDEFAHASVAPWSMGTFVDRGQMFVTVDRSSTALGIVWPSLGRSATQTIDFRPEFLCGFRNSPQIAAADAASVRLFSYSVDSATRVKVTSRTLRAVSQITAIACMPRADTVAIAESNGSLSIVDMMHGRRTPIVAASERSFSALVPSNGGRFIAAIAPAMESFTLYSTDRGGQALGTRALRDPGCYACAGRLAFDASDSRIAWIDGSRVEVGRVAAVSAGSEGYECESCRTDAIIAWSAQEPLPKILLPGAVARFDGVAREYRSIAKYRLPPGSALPPVYDPDSPSLDPHVATQESDGVAFRSLADGRPPMIGIKAECSLPDSYAVMRSSLLLGGMGLSATKFASGGGGENALRCSRTDPILADSGDGEHAVWLDAESGVLTLLRVVDQGLPALEVQKLSSFVLPQELHGESRGDYQAAYDAARRVISVASSWGVQQFTAEGRGLGGLTRSRLDELGGGGHSDCPLRLSPRGMYVFVPNAKAKCQTDVAAPAAAIPGTLVTTSGVRVNGSNFSNLWRFSRDDRFAFGVGPAHGSVVYRLPSMESVSLGAAPVREGIIDVAPDGDTLAYQTNDRQIQLFDLERQAPVASALPMPPHFDAFLGLRFSPDGKHLVAPYRASDGTWLLAAYDLDPAYWRRQLCDQTKDLTLVEKRRVGQVLLASQRNTAEDLEIAAGDAAFKNVCPPR